MSEPSTTSPSRGLVLGGGASLGRAFHWGLAAGFLEAGIDLRQADRIVGTSAGAVIGVQLALGTDPRLAPPAIDAPSSANIGSAFQRLMEACGRAVISENPEEDWRSIGQLALAAPTPDEATSLARTTLSELVGLPWPESFWATAVDARTGHFKYWDAASGVPLERGVAASGALPGVWPPVTIGKSRYIDGGVRSMLNADLAIGVARVLVISCFDLSSVAGTPKLTRLMNDALHAELDRLRAEKSIVEVITPGKAFLELSGYGTKMLDGSLVPAAYELSKTQAANEADRVRGLWSQPPVIAE